MDPKPATPKKSTTPDETKAIPHPEREPNLGNPSRVPQVAAGDKATTPTKKPGSAP